MTADRSKRRRRFMISVRTMMLVVLVSGGCLGWFVRRVQIPAVLETPVRPARKTGATQKSSFDNVGVRLKMEQTDQARRSLEHGC